MIKVILIIAALIAIVFVAFYIIIDTSAEKLKSTTKFFNLCIGLALLCNAVVWKLYEGKTSNLLITCISAGVYTFIYTIAVLLLYDKKLKPETVAESSAIREAKLARADMGSWTAIKKGFSNRIKLQGILVILICILLFLSEVYTGSSNTTQLAEAAGIIVFMLFVREAEVISVSEKIRQSFIERRAAAERESKREANRKHIKEIEKEESEKRKALIAERNEIVQQAKEKLYPSLEKSWRAIAAEADTAALREWVEFIEYAIPGWDTLCKKAMGGPVAEETVYGLKPCRNTEDITEERCLRPFELSLEEIETAILKSRTNLWGFTKTFADDVYPSDFFAQREEAWETALKKNLSKEELRNVLAARDFIRSQKEKRAQNGYNHKMYSRAAAPGENAEKNVQYALNWWAKSNKSKLIKKDCKSKYSDACIRLRGYGDNDEPQEFDHILVTPAGVLAIETKDYAGSINIIDTDTWQRMKNGVLENCKSPAAQVKRHEYVLRSALRGVEIKSIIVLANEHAVIKGEENSEIPVISFRSLESYLDRLSSNSRYSAEEISGIAEIIEGMKVRR